MVATWAIYLVSAYEEPIDAAKESNAEAGGSIGARGMGTLVQTTFFAIAGLASISMAAWIIIVSRKRRMIQQQTPYIVAAGSVFLIVLYIISRIVNLPIVGIQEDIGTIDILSKMLQGTVIGLSIYTISISRKTLDPIKNRL